MRQIIEKGTITEIQTCTGRYLGLKSDNGWWRNINVHLIRPYIGKRVVIYIEAEHQKEKESEMVR